MATSSTTKSTDAARCGRALEVGSMSESGDVSEGAVEETGLPEGLGCSGACCREADASWGEGFGRVTGEAVEARAAYIATRRREKHKRQHEIAHAPARRWPAFARTTTRARLDHAVQRAQRSRPRGRPFRLSQSLNTRHSQAIFSGEAY